MKNNTAIAYTYTFDSLETRTVHHASVSQAGVDIRVDWAGGSNAGTVEALVDQGIWEACVNIETEGPCDVLMSATSDHVRLSRGPKWGMYPFEAKLVPIQWKDGHEPGGDLPDDYVVELGLHYEYPAGIAPDSVPWQESSEDQGVHALTLQHEQALSFELWVRLLDPAAPQNWLALRPIVRPGDGDPTPT